jgi:hypothetical protein
MPFDLRQGDPAGNANALGISPKGLLRSTKKSQNIDSERIESASFP